METKQILINELKQRTKENKDLFLKCKMNYLKALAINETNLSIDDQAKRTVLKNNVFNVTKDNLRRYKEENKRILHNEKYIRDYLMSKNDFKKYCQLVHQERIKLGLNCKDWNTTADAESRPLLNLCRKEFLKVALKCLPSSMQEQFKPIVESYHYKHTDKFLDLALRLGV